MDYKKLRELAYAAQDYTTKMRREFHEHPDLSSNEHHTREVLIRELKDMGAEYELLEGTGILAKIVGGKPGKCRALRSDIDALPIQENPQNLKRAKECISKVDGVCHACGHDAHMAMLLTTMRILTQLKDEIEGTVYCCFEQGEEDGTGWTPMLAALDPYPIEECFALHCSNNIDTGHLNLVAGPRIAGLIGIGINVHGKAGHGSRPDQAINPIIAGAQIITNIDSALRNQMHPEKTVTVGIGTFQAGKSFNVIPDDAYIGGSARFFDIDEREKTLKIITKTAETVGACHNCKIDFNKDFHRVHVTPVINTEETTARTRAAIEAACGPEVLVDADRWYASETFSHYIQKYTGAMGFLGIRNEEYGSGANLHHGQFDLDEKGLPLGVCAELCFVFGSQA